MKQGQIIKNAKLNKEELALINRYTRREMSEEEVYTFSVVLCDNDIDRDFERFDEQALNTLKELFVGKTGVFDHDPKAENQTARIYDCTVERITARKTRTGEDYLRLIAKAYLPRSKRNEDFILALDSGIQKEVSVGCAVSGNICSICGADRKKNACRHQKGKTYGGKLCHDVLTGVTDAYEWSFVAVPAQRSAGVIKSWKTQEGQVKELKEITKALSFGGDVSLSAQEVKKLYSYLQTLEADAQYGRQYHEDLKSEVVRLSVLVQPDIGKRMMESLADKMDIAELKAFRSAYERKSAALFERKPQLFQGDGQERKIENNQEYHI